MSLDRGGFGRVLTLGASWESAVRRLFQHGTPGTSDVDPDIPPDRNCAVVRRLADALRLRLRELQPDPNGSLRRDRSRRPWPATASDTLGSVWSPELRHVRPRARPERVHQGPVNPQHLLPRFCFCRRRAGLLRAGQGHHPASRRVDVEPSLPSWARSTLGGLLLVSIMSALLAVAKAENERRRNRKPTMRRGERQRKRGTTTGGETETDSYRFTSGTRSGACARHELGIQGSRSNVRLCFAG